MTFNNVTHKAASYAPASGYQITAKSSLPSFWTVIKTLALGCLAAITSPAAAAQSLQSRDISFKSFPLETCPAIPPYLNPTPFQNDALKSENLWDSELGHEKIIDRLSQLVRSCPEASKVFASVFDQGGFDLRLARVDMFNGEAFTSMSTRTITLLQSSEKALIHNLIFEIVNLNKSEAFLPLLNNKCTFDSSKNYVIEIEKLEFETNKETARIFKQCDYESLSSEKFSLDASLSFEEHVDLQLSSGHTFVYEMRWLEECNKSVWINGLKEFVTKNYDNQVWSKLLNGEFEATERDGIFNSFNQDEALWLATIWSKNSPEVRLKLLKEYLEAKKNHPESA